MDKRCAVKDKVLLNFVMEVHGTQLAQGRHFVHEHIEDAPTWGSPRMREHSVSTHAGDRGARWQGMRGSTVTHKPSSVSLFRETMRAIAAQCRREGFLMCQQLRQSLDSGCAVFALEPPNKEVLPEIEGTEVRDKRKIWPFGVHEGIWTQSPRRSCRRN